MKIKCIRCYKDTSLYFLKKGSQVDLDQAFSSILDFNPYSDEGDSKFQKLLKKWYSITSKEELDEQFYFAEFVKEENNSLIYKLPEESYGDRIEVELF